MNASSEDIKSYFDTFDTDKNGVLDKVEFRQVLEQMGIPEDES